MPKTGAGQENNLDAAMMDRLAITSAGVQAMAEGVRQVAALADPVGQISDGVLPSGIHTTRCVFLWAWWGLSMSPAPTLLWMRPYCV